MNTDLVEITHHQTFESLKQEEEDGCEFWSARKLAKSLEYNEYRNFINVIEKAKEACLNSQHNIVDHFVDVTEMVDVGSGGRRKIADIRLSRYACYLVVQNGDPAKPVIANGQTYFQIKLTMK
jgi:DNA-damage-inducible protein D